MANKLSERERLNRVRQAVDLRRVARDPQEVGHRLVTRIHHYHRDLAVRVDEGRRKERAPAWRAGDSPRARAHELREVPDVVIGVRVYQLTGAQVRMHRREAEVAD